jgi:hypothetical protein
MALSKVGQNGHPFCAKPKSEVILAQSPQSSQGGKTLEVANNSAGWWLYQVDRWAKQGRNRKTKPGGEAVNEGRTRVGLRDAAVAVVLCIFVLMTAGAMRMGGRLYAKTLMCTVNLKEMAQAVNVPYSPANFTEVAVCRWMYALAK